MKLLKTWIVCIIFLFVFVFFGGWMLFDFSRHAPIALLATAFVLATLICILMSMSDRIDALEAEIKELKKTGFNIRK